MTLEVDIKRYFSEIKNHKSSVIEDFFINQKFEIDSNLSFSEIYTAHIIPVETLFKDPFLVELNKKFKLDKSFVFEMQPFCTFPWHRHGDGTHPNSRKVTLQSMFTISNPNKSKCMFMDYNPKQRDIYPSEFYELKFDSNNYYVFNAGEFHSILNLDQTRFVLEIYFENKDLTYDEVLTHINNM